MPTRRGDEGRISAHCGVSWDALRAEVQAHRLGFGTVRALRLAVVRAGCYVPPAL